MEWRKTMQQGRLTSARIHLKVKFAESLFKFTNVTRKVIFDAVTSPEEDSRRAQRRSSFNVTPWNKLVVLERHEGGGGRCRVAGSTRATFNSTDSRMTHGTGESSLGELGRGTRKGNRGTKKSAEANGVTRPISTNYNGYILIVVTLPRHNLYHGLGIHSVKYHSNHWTTPYVCILPKLALKGSDLKC